MTPFETALVAAGGTILVALIGALSLYVQRKVRGPATINDLVLLNEATDKRNNALLDRVAELERLMGEMNKKLRDQEHDNRILGEGFDSLIAAVDRSDVELHFTQVERAAVEQARVVRGEDPWPTINPAAPTS